MLKTIISTTIGACLGYLFTLPFEHRKAIKECVNELLEIQLALIPMKSFTTLFCYIIDKCLKAEGVRDFFSFFASITVHRTEFKIPKIKTEIMNTFTTPVFDMFLHEMVTFKHEYDFFVIK